MRIYQTLAAKRMAMLLVAGLLSVTVYAWAAPEAGGRGERFKQADKDGNGLLSRDETGQGTPRLAKNFDAIDVNQDGQLSRDEIRTYLMDRRMSAANRASYSQSRCQKQGAEAK